MKPVPLAAVCAIAGCLFGAPLSGHAALTPFRVEQTVELRFPTSLLLDAVYSGDVWVLVSVGADGRLADALVTRYTHRELVGEALYAVGRWRFEPARRDGQAVRACAELHIRFEATGAVVSLDQMTRVTSLSAFARQNQVTRAVCRASELDRPLTTVRVVTPAAPPQAGGGKAVIDFIIDEKGQPRMPVLVSTTAAEYSALAASALAQWQFTPPTRRGQPVAVPARQEFVFPARS